MSKLNKGEVAIVLDGTDYTLKPSLSAFSALGSRFESYGELLTKIAAGNVPAIVLVLRHGLGFNDAQTKRLPDMVFRTGIAAVSEALTDYVFRLFNSGKGVDEVTADRLHDGASTVGGGDEENPLLA